MKIILIGYPCSGKGTQAQFISKKYQIPKISTGDLLRKKIFNKKINSNKKINDKIKSGKLVSDKIIISLIKKRLKKNDCLKGYVLDGFPRTLNQFKIMHLEKINIDFLIEILVSKKNIFKRALGRQIHIPSGRIYHNIYNPPLIKNKDDITGEKLIIREDDTKKIIEKRLKEYEIFKKKIFKYCTKKKILKNLKYFTINGNKNLKKIKHSIQKILIK
ncbi:Adenylate kinase [Buchnera aphidicola (Periphyllus testudinaceus)]|uniref:adenylate kinase family protein n=1 Tax=Buchnera aphidicola TaxID=9 RepID=UPI00346495C8